MNQSSCRMQERRLQTDMLPISVTADIFKDKNSATLPAARIEFDNAQESTGKCLEDRYIRL